MTPEEQLEVLSQVWGKDKGYVFCPYIPADVARTPQRKQHWHEGQAFQWPAESDRILNHLRAHTDDDLYFAPNVFSSKGRRAELAIKGDRQWADLDESDPRLIDDPLRPNLAWETSPDRYAAVWFMDEPREDIAKAGNENHRLSIHLGADPSGWDTTQLLRVPGSANNKPGKPDGCRGKLLWSEGTPHAWDAFDALPTIEVPEPIGDVSVSDDDIAAVNRAEVLARVRKQLPRNIRTLVRLRDNSGMPDTSGKTWAIEKELAKAGCSLVEMIAIIRPSVWNKWNDQPQRLIDECAKAHAAVHKNKEDDVSDDGIEEVGDDGVGKKKKKSKEFSTDLVAFTEDPSVGSERIPELVRGLMHERPVGFIAGPPKSMKTWFALYLAVCLTTRTKFVGHGVTRKVNVLVIEQEDRKAIVDKRLGLIYDSVVPEYHPHGQLHLTSDGEGVEWGPAEDSPAKLYVAIKPGFVVTDKDYMKWLKSVSHVDEVTCGT
ncbi:AAA family ATPase [Rhodococcus opacus]|uniref:AAA family ATPase n=1 Tax=Rhodococcus opacus TaxID=37919 RepID=UPI002236901A|nr:AAA family ATPase [Rhodococcus opacus]UZG58008.1 AAA family ATPase [Rhodococcus opacus]